MRISNLIKRAQLDYFLQFSLPLPSSFPPPPVMSDSVRSEEVMCVAVMMIDDVW